LRRWTATQCSFELSDLRKAISEMCALNGGPLIDTFDHNRFDVFERYNGVL
jgi:hypothetical protein